ncbi:regulatory signaling modulator protein AmpE [bacterium SCSIO 12696]|nr:regulatory signaling modulator protein AmpE [bacterium SCSIO 12696]
MEFLVILAALGLHRVVPDLRLLHQDGWFFVWLGKFGSPSAVKFIVSLLVPVAALWLLDCFAAQWWGWLGSFAFGLLVLLYCLGRGNLPANLDAIEEHVERDDQQAVYHDLAKLEGEESERASATGAPSTPEELHQALLQNLSYRFFEHSFPVVFWFFVLGPAGALLYRLSELQANKPITTDQQEVEDEAPSCPVMGLAQRWLWLMEWLPVRILGFSFALVGNFACCLHHWKECVVCPVRTTGQVLLHYVVGALSANVDTADIEVAELEMVRTLFHRAMMLWVCVIAFIVVL